MATLNKSEMLESSGDTGRKFLCLTICGYRKAGMSEEDYRNHMVNVSAPMTKDLMVKYGVKRWTQIHNQSATRALMYQLFDAQMCNLADFDCFSQVVFENVENYRRMKDDPWYKQHLMGDHLKFADTKKSMMTIGWVEEFVRDGKVVDGFKDSDSQESWVSSLGKVAYGLTVAFGLVRLLDFYGYSVLHRR